MAVRLTAGQRPPSSGGGEVDRIDVVSYAGRIFAPTLASSRKYYPIQQIERGSYKVQVDHVVGFPQEIYDSAFLIRPTGAEEEHVVVVPGGVGVHKWSAVINFPENSSLEIEFSSASLQEEIPSSINIHMYRVYS